MSTPPYNLHNLRQLMASSPAYASLGPAEKANIEAHIRQNNKPVLLYVYHHLIQEQQALDFSREKLAKNVLTPKTAALDGLRTALQDNFAAEDLSTPPPDSQKG